MKPTTQQTRPKAWIPFTNFAVVDSVPEKLKLQNCLFPYSGALEGNDYIWGLYGTLSSNQGLFAVDTFARKQGKMSLTVQGWYRVDNFEKVRSQIDEAIAEDSGFLHLERLKSTYRDQLKELVLDYIERELPGLNLDLHKDRSLHDLVLYNPKLIKVIFDYNEKINMIVHPVHQMFDPSDRRTLTVSTMRMIKDRVMSVQVRYLEDKIDVNW